MDRDKSRVPALWIVLAGAFVLRLAAAVLVQHWVGGHPGRLCLIEGDAESYWALARHIARGEDYAVFEPPRYVLRMPGFPLLLAAGIKLFGEQMLAIRVLLAAVGTAACGLVYWLALELFDRATALRACLFASVLPSFIVFSVLLLSETPFAAMLLVSLIALAKLVKLETGGWANSRQPVDGLAARDSRRAIGLSVVAGVLIGLATLVRPTWLLAGPGFVFFYLLIARNRSRAAIHSGLLLAALAVTLLPWTIRNWYVTGHFVPTTLWVGPSLYDGLNPDATGASDMTFEDEWGFYRHESEYEADRHYRRLAWEFARANLGQALSLAWKKLGRFWNPAPNAEQFGHWAVAGTLAVLTVVLYVLAIRGGWSVRHSLWRWLIPASPAVYFSLVHLVFVGSVRYRLPAEYALVVLAAAGSFGLLRHVHSSSAAFEGGPQTT
jgi:4-amino-4-deoxy-L-arabinose transferase-like glycosyltransferase